MSKAPIALLTDFGLKDPYAGLLKAVIASINPEARVLDLSHGVEPMHILQGACVLGDCYRFYPKGTIFVCVVDPGVGTKRKILCARSRDYFFIGPDNSLLSLALAKEAPPSVLGRENKDRGKKLLTVRHVENQKYFLRSLSSTFHGRDIMSPVAAHLSLDPKIFEDLGPVTWKYEGMNWYEAEKDKSGMKGRILYFDHYGNGITNIKAESVEPEFWKRAEVRVGGKNLGSIRPSYGLGKPVLCAILNSFSRLEIALPGGSARDMHHLKIGDKVTVEK